MNNHRTVTALLARGAWGTRMCLLLVPHRRHALRQAPPAGQGAVAAATPCDDAMPVTADHLLRPGRGVTPATATRSQLLFSDFQSILSAGGSPWTPPLPPQN
jgi:hypothetical protein